MAGRLAGKVCIITGTGGSIGRATALAFAREGAAIAGCDVDVESAEETVALVHDEKGSMVSLQPSLLDDPSECAKLVELAAPRVRPARRFVQPCWPRRDEVDLIFYLTPAAWPHLKASRGVDLVRAHARLTSRLAPGALHWRGIRPAGVAFTALVVRHTIPVNKRQPEVHPRWWPRCTWRACRHAPRVLRRQRGSAFSWTAGTPDRCRGRA
jgi:NAD(P)-dependent dehydrogenase (short-subunit alcohol dehydrogenase family)